MSFIEKFKWVMANISESAELVFKSNELCRILFTPDIDDRLALEYLYDDFNNTWHGSWEELIESYYTHLKGHKSFRKVEFESIERWYSNFMRHDDFKKLMEDEEIIATIKDMEDYKDARKAAYNIAYYPRYKGNTAFERLIKGLYREYKAAKVI
jgi:hypothetical protein